MSPESISTVASRRLRLIGLVAGIAAIALAVYGVVDRARSKQEVVLPGNVSAFYTGSIYARVNGYVKDWYEDIGAHVKKGQVLAVIDSPDLDQQLAQARADLVTSFRNKRRTKNTETQWQRPLMCRPPKPMWPGSKR
jgi:multidrug efflux pump subunit AcrA (membrane-fusion protein)